MPPGSHFRVVLGALGTLGRPWVDLEAASEPLLPIFWGMLFLFVFVPPRATAFSQNCSPGGQNGIRRQSKGPVRREQGSLLKQSPEGGQQNARPVWLKMAQL